MDVKWKEESGRKEGEGKSDKKTLRRNYGPGTCRWLECTRCPSQKSVAY